MSYEQEPRSEAEAPERKKRGWLRWVGIGVAAAVLILGVVSLISSVSRHAREEQTAAIEALKTTIESEAQELEELQADYDAAAEALEKKQAEYDEARAKHDSGVVEDAQAGQQSLDALRADAEQKQKDYSTALEAYDASVDLVEQNVMGYASAAEEMKKLEPFLGYADAYEQYLSGAAQELPGMDPGAEPDAQTWYSTVVFPAATQAGVGLPPQVEGFPSAVKALAADPSAKVQAYEDAVAATKDAEAKLAEANTAQETAAKAYADGKAAQKTSEDWLTDCEAELERLENRVKDLEESIRDVTASLDQHRAELKKLEGK